MSSENKPKILDKGAPTEISDESRNYTQNYGFVRNFGRGPLIEDFGPVFGRQFSAQKIWMDVWDQKDEKTA